MAMTILRWLLLGPLLVWSASVRAQTPDLTSAQVATLRTNILASPDAGPLCVAGDLSGVTTLYNVTAVPDFWVWKTSVTKEELTNATSVDATVFTWVGNGFIMRSAGEQAAWRELFTAAGTINPSLSQVRQAFSDIFSGTGNAAANRTHLLAVARRKSTRLERVFATGTGTTGSPGVLVIEGPLNYTTLIGQCP